MKKLTFNDLQFQVGEWSRRNFPNNKPETPFKGIVEEVGELAHALLKREQGIRGTQDEHIIAAQDAVGDILVYMADFCERQGWSMQAIIEHVWGQVQQRDWNKNKQTGAVS